MRFVYSPALAFEVNLNIPRDPAITSYFYFTSGSVVSAAIPFSLQVKSCAG